VPDDRCDLLCLDLPRAEELRRRWLPAEVTEVMATRVRALGDPTRLGLVAALSAGGELCVCDLAWISGRAQNLVSHHLRALKATGLASSRREGKIVFYSLTEEGERLFGLLAGRPALTELAETRR
jgi:ArsR family transcriptional regulator, lead/cadmium/zinc/bismuth-responsive transcriptional repressor